MVGPGAEVDPQPAVGEDVAGKDAVARAGLDVDSGVYVERDRVARAGGQPADLVVGGGVDETHAIDLDAQRERAGDVGADEVALNEVIHRRNAGDGDTPMVGGDQVPCHGR